jgi:hypothetical protein
MHCSAAALPEIGSLIVQASSLVTRHSSLGSSVLRFSGSSYGLTHANARDMMIVYQTTRVNKIA